MAQKNWLTADLDIGGTAYRVRRARVSEAMSEVPHATFELADDLAALPDPAELVGKDLVLTFTPSDEMGGEARWFRGVVVDASRTVAHRESHVRVVAAPRLWRLEKRQDCRIFQDQSAVDVVSAVLDQAGVKELEKRLSGSYAKRTTITQYRETDLAFVLRLCSEEGIYLHYEFKDKELLVLADDPKGTGDAGAELTFQPAMGFELPADVVTEIRQTHRVKTDKVFVRDYDFERPRLDLEASVEGKDDGAHALEVYAYPGRFTDAAVGKQYAQVLLDSLQCQRNIVTARTSSLALWPGLRAKVANHPYEPLNAEYLVTGVVTQYEERRPVGDFATGSVYFHTEFTGVPTETSPYRPPRRPRAAHVAAIQTAVTTGPSGQEIYTDKHGRVKVHFPWDRAGKPDETSSIWMRTSQLPTGGSMLLPRVGWEVLVQAYEGDPDHPLVMGRVYNAEKPPPYKLPDHKVRSAIQTATTPGGGSVNEIRTHDAAGSEEMFVNASKDTTIKVNNNATESVGNDETRTIGSNQTIEITNSDDLVIGGNQTVDVGGDQDVHVSTFMVDDTAGDHSLTVGGNRDMKIGGDHRITVGGNASLSVGSLGTSLVVGKICEKVGADYELDVGAVRAAITAGDHNVSVSGNHDESDGLLKVIVAFGGKSVDVAGSYMLKAAGAVLAKVDGDHAESAGASFTEVAAGAHILKCDNAVFEADNVLSLVMGASTLTMTPASVSIAGISVKIDGATAETSALILDN